MSLIELTTEIKAPIEICFDLARSIDLHKLSTKETNEEAISGVTSGLIGLGETVTWRAKHFGITQKLSSKITEYKYPYYFRDEMIKGAFKKISHKHEFGTKGNCTRMTDHFEYEVPFGVAGKIFDRLILSNYLKCLLEKRNIIIKEVAESEQWKVLLNK